nr:hypothetical protein [uncultured Acetatifactor sp.]
MGRTSLNDLEYSFEPLKIVTPDPDHKVDEAELQKSIQKSKEMVEIMIYQMEICVKEGGPAVGPSFINVREGSVEE